MRVRVLKAVSSKSQAGKRPRRAGGGELEKDKKRKKKNTRQKRQIKTKFIQGG